MKAQLEKHRFKIIAVVCVAVLLGLGAVWKWHQSQERRRYQQEAARKQQSSKKYVQVFQVEKQSFKDALTGLMGTIKSSSLELKSNQEEILVSYHFKPGAYVKKGQIIAELDHVRTHSKLRQAEIANQRKKSLYDVGGASRTELEESAEMVKLARKDYEDTFIRAPKNGRLGEVVIQEGELVNRAHPIAYFVSEEDYFYLEVSVIEKHLSEIVNGQKARIDIPAISQDPIAGYVLSVSPEITTTSRMIPVRIKIDPKVSHQLRPGLSASCSIVTYDQTSTVIPKTALLQDGERVLVVNEDHKIEERAVQLGYASRDYVSIVDGLKDHDLVVARPGYADVQPGEQVRYGKPEVYKEL